MFFKRNGRTAAAAMETVRLRRSRPSALALALALALTMLFVWLISLSALPKARDTIGAATAASSAEVRLEGLETWFYADALCDDLIEARVLAAKCAQNGGAGLLMAADGAYAVVRDCGAEAEGVIARAAKGLTLRLSGRADEIAAVSDAAAFLHAQARQTGSLAGALESGETDADALRALLGVFRTQAFELSKRLTDVDSAHPAPELIRRALDGARSRLDCAVAATDAGKIRLIHAAACADWISLIETLQLSADAQPGVRDALP